jgi:hypothetical protein
VSARFTQRTRTSGFQSSFSASSASTFSLRTDDPSLSTTLAPAVTVVLGFGKQPGLRAVSRRLAPPLPSPGPPRLANGSSDPAIADLDAPDRAVGENSSSDSAGAHGGATDLFNEGVSGLPSAEGGAEGALRADASRHRGEKHHRQSDAPSESDAALTGEREFTEGEVAEAEADKPAHPHRIEMTIDSLPHHDLTEPIPIHIDPLGDTVFTATVSNLDISATGNSIGEALVLLKEQIEFRYNDLNRRPKRSPDQTTMLQMLHTYIAPSGAKPAWL